MAWIEKLLGRDKQTDGPADGQDPAADTPLLMPAEQPKLSARLRTWFLTGVVVAMPVWITAYVGLGFIDFIDDSVTAIFPPRYNPDLYLPFSVPGLGVVVLIILLTLIGFLTANFLGRSTLAYAERLVDRMPVVRNVYGTLKQIFEAAVNQSGRSFREACLIEYPRRGVWALGFVTATTKGEVAEKARNEGGEELVSVFVPTTPNPTSGFLLFVPKSDVKILDMPIEEAAKLVVSAGMVTPGLTDQDERYPDRQ